MPTATDIRVNTRVLHRSRGRGKVVRLYGDHREVAVLFDGAWSATRVQVCDLVPMPARMPKAVAVARSALSLLDKAESRP